MDFKNFVETANLLEASGYDSLNLHKQVGLLTEAEQRLLQAALQFVVRNKLPVVVIGGVAVVSYISSARDLTPDVDFLTDDLNTIKASLDQNGMQYRPLASFMVNGVQVGGIQVPDINADFLFANAGINRYIMKSAELRRFGGVQLPFATAEVLAIQKFVTARARDSDDAFLLLQSGRLDQKKFLTHVKRMEKLGLLAPRGSGDAGDPEELESYAGILV